MVAPGSGRRGAATWVGACVIIGLAAGLTPAEAGEPTYNWSGVYVGAHMGGAIDYSNFSNPYGPTLFGNDVRSPGPFGGLQIGTNYQSGLAVFGLQADVSGANMHGTFTCMQPELSVPGPPPAANFIGGAFGATCQSEPDWFGTVTGRAGIALGPQGRILLYGKGGLAWMHNSINMAVDNITAGDFGPENERSKSNFTQLGWTLGAGGEVALTGRWSLGLEYDYLHFGGHDVATPPAGPISGGGLPGIVGSTAPDGRAASVSQDVHAVKIALNYRLYDYGAPPTLDELAGNVQAVHVPGFQTEFGGRYVYGWTRFQKDLGNSANGLPVNNSRLTWDKMTTSSGELFGRIDTPENIMVKGFLGMGRGDQGHINDEDWGNRTPDPPAPATLVTGYSNTDSATTEKIRYFTLDVGYDVLRAPNYKVTPFIGYSYFRYMLSAFGCTDLTLSPAANCMPPDASNRQLFLGEKDFLDLLAAWHIRRAAADAMAAPDRRRRLSAHRELRRNRFSSAADQGAEPVFVGDGQRQRRAARGYRLLRCDTGVQRWRGRTLLGNAEHRQDALVQPGSRAAPRLASGAGRRVCAGLLQVRRR